MPKNPAGIFVCGIFVLCIFTKTTIGWQLGRGRATRSCQSSNAQVKLPVETEPRLVQTDFLSIILSLSFNWPKQKNRQVIFFKFCTLGFNIAVLSLVLVLQGWLYVGFGLKGGGGCVMKQPSLEFVFGWEYIIRKFIHIFICIYRQSPIFFVFNSNSFQSNTTNMATLVGIMTLCHH